MEFKLKEYEQVNYDAMLVEFNEAVTKEKEQIEVLNQNINSVIKF